MILCVSGYSTSLVEAQFEFQTKHLSLINQHAQLRSCMNLTADYELCALLKLSVNLLLSIWGILSQNYLRTAAKYQRQSNTCG